MIFHKILYRAHVLIAILILSSCTTLSTNGKNASGVFERASQSTVVVISYNRFDKISSFGSGVVLPDGSIATNYHVIEKADRIYVLYRGREYPASEEFTDWGRDVCTIRASGFRAPPVTYGRATELKVGSRVYAIGAPEGLELTLSEGIISGFRQVEGGYYIQTTAPVSPGSSGGGLFNEKGQLIGLVSFFHKGGQNLNFALPVQWIVELPERHVKKQPSFTAMSEWYKIALLLETKKDWRELELHAKRKLEVEPNNSVAWYCLGRVYHYTGRAYKAVEAFKQVCRLDPDNALSWNGLGGAYETIGKTHRAIEAYKKALSIDPDLAYIWNNLGAAYTKIGQRYEAVASYKQALLIDPLNTDTIYNVGVEFKKAGLKEELMAAYRLLKSLDPDKAAEFYKYVVRP